jgi:WhiB family redox-sensing transcriptional regulator
LPSVASGVGFLGWMSRGACGGSDPELFFPVAGTAGPAVRQAEAAKAVCRRCVVRANCLSYALEAMPMGIWGGTTEEERRAARGSSVRRANSRPNGSASAVMPRKPAARAGRAEGQLVVSGKTA